MAFTQDNTLAAIVAQARIDELAGGSIEFLDGSSNVLASLALSSPAGTVSNKTTTFGTISDDISINQDGTAASARIKDSGGTVRISGLTVGTTGTDVVVNSTAFVTGKECSMSSLTFTDP